MNAYLINMHLLVARSRSNIKVTFLKNGWGGDIRVSPTHLVFFLKRFFPENAKSLLNDGIFDLSVVKAFADNKCK